ncbi:MAG: hypothetical protein Q7S57_02905 [bacterium]|nr:hypothetical protein [bacterium]
MARFIMVVVMMMVVVTARAETLTGEKVDVRIDVEGVSTRFFEPRDIAGTVDGGSQDATYRFRYTLLQPGDAYSIAVQSRSNGLRYGIGVAVDGRCILTGMKVPATVQMASSWPNMYVVGGRGGEFRGWREDAGNIRRFVVSSEDRSLAATLWNDRSATGTIVVSIFRETPSQEPMMKGERGVKGLGTAAGEREESRVVSVDFTSRPVAYEVFVLRYASKPELKKLGVWTEEAVPNRFWPTEKPFIGRIPE